MAASTPRQRKIRNRFTRTITCRSSAGGMSTAATGVRQNPAQLRVVADAAAGSSGIRISGVSKTYRSRDGDVPSLRPLDFQINEGEFFVVVGPSGCGKSTLLKMISGLLSPSSGEI